MARNLVVLIAVIVMTSSTGCRLWERWQQGDYCDPCMQESYCCPQTTYMGMGEGYYVDPMMQGGLPTMPAPDSMEALPAPQPAAR